MQHMYGILAEWLRRKIRNLLGSARAGSNPADVVFFFRWSESAEIELAAVLVCFYNMCWISFLIVNALHTTMWNLYTGGYILTLESSRFFLLKIFPPASPRSHLLLLVSYT